MKSKAWGVLAVTFGLVQTGCASHSSSIEAAYVSPNVYDKWSCDELFDEKERIFSEVKRVSGLQDENADGDAILMTVGLVIFWPALIGMTMTKDREAELSRLKGEYEAVDTQIKTKKCSLSSPSQQVRQSEPRDSGSTSTYGISSTAAADASTDRREADLASTDPYRVSINWAESRAVRGEIDGFIASREDGLFKLETNTPAWSCLGEWWPSAKSHQNNDDLASGQFKMTCDKRGTVTGIYRMDTSLSGAFRGTDNNGDYVEILLLDRRTQTSSAF